MLKNIFYTIANVFKQQVIKSVQETFFSAC